MIAKGKTTRIFIYTACLLSGVAIANAAQYGEVDFRRQSKFCEAATRLPWGDVDLHRWAACVMHQQVSIPKTPESNTSMPKTVWYSELQRSSIDATDEGCQAWASKQPSDPPRMRQRGVYLSNHAWNLCMERQGLFAVPQGRTAQESRPPDFRTMAAEQRVTTVIAEGYGCRSQKSYDEIVDRLVDFSFASKSKDSVEIRNPEDIKRKTRELAAANPACRLWTIGERVKVQAHENAKLCLVPDASDTCYWADTATVNAWE